MEWKQFKTPFILFLLGGSMYLAGAFFKILHWEVGIINGANLLILGSLLDFAAIVIFIIKMLSIYKKEKK